ncbi:hypothetical protein [Thermohalobacter berrensis]|uniref:Sialidase domain-containing protein n=1 Tax=Thermohalobacter berrensis TaxID=99594 RepID=A0A419T5L1_9FIRM|nr:hypothetical protein [Thermohalobacter berrensis]RKD32723.1 hypothetical protein BET03_10325 [Thermohalobacter berrensis]
MSFSNQKSCLLSDGLGNLYNFLWNNGNIELIFFDKKIKQVRKRNIDTNCNMEFDGLIDEKNNIYMVYVKKDGKLVLLTRIEGQWDKKAILEDNEKDLFYVNAVVHGDEIHTFYCKQIEDSNIYGIYHYYFKNNEWFIKEVDKIEKGEILNPIQVIKEEDKLILGYYNIVDGIEQIFIKEYDLEKENWANSIQLTSNFDKKLYLDILAENKEVLHLVYSKYKNGNLTINYEKHRLYNNKTRKIKRGILSNPANCSFPTLAIYNNKLWTIWTEYDYVISRYSSDMGKSWSPLYRWKNTKENIFLRYKFSTNDEKIKGKFKFNYSYGLGHPNITFTGFGPLNKATEVPLKKK